jgi:hypothetical protein
MAADSVYLSSISRPIIDKLSADIDGFQALPPALSILSAR